jgi:hypothetical protein
VGFKPLPEIVDAASAIRVLHEGLA